MDEPALVVSFPGCPVLQQRLSTMNDDQNWVMGLKPGQLTTSEAATLGGMVNERCHLDHLIARLPVPVRPNSNSGPNLNANPSPNSPGSR